MRVLLGVTGGIAAYKVASVLRTLKRDGHDVWVVPTPHSLKFVGQATWEALSGHPAPSDTFHGVSEVTHVKLGQQAQAILVAPATADFLAQMASGHADHLLGNSVLASEAPIMVAPAMHTEMWNHPATQHNVATLRDRGVHVLEPAVGQLTGPDVGPGRLPEPEDIVAAFYAALDGTVTTASAPWNTDLTGVRVLISAGGTREPLDAVRYIGNYSTGHQGMALAEAARERGASVTIVAANVMLPSGEGIERIEVETSQQLADRMMALSDAADVIVMAAAVADFRPAHVVDHKIKKGQKHGLTLHLELTPDILSALVSRRGDGQTIVGFAAETGDQNASSLEHGRAKAIRKQADLLVVNAVGNGRGFGDVSNEVTILDAQGTEVANATGPKLRIAHAILDCVVDRRKRESMPTG